MAFYSLFLLSRPYRFPRRARPARARTARRQVSGLFRGYCKPEPAVQWPGRRSGGIGRRAGLKIRCPSGRVGSSPTFGISIAGMRVGVLTGGGDCPGLNAVIRAAGRRVMTRGGEVIGVREGWKGLVEGLFEPLGPREISGLLPRGGAILGTTRTHPFQLAGGGEKVLSTSEREGVA